MLPVRDPAVERVAPQETDHADVPTHHPEQCSEEAQRTPVTAVNVRRV